MLIAVLCVGLLGSCIEIKPPVSEKAKAPIRIGVGHRCALVLWDVAKEKGFFEKRGVSAEIVRFDRWRAAIDAFNKGKLDAVHETVATTIVEAAKGARERKIVALVGCTSSANGIVSRSEVANVADLRGRRVAVERGTEDYYMLLFALRESGLDPREVEILDTPGQDAIPALINGRVDAVVVWEPYLSAARQAADGNIIYMSRSEPGFFVDDIVFSADVLKTRPRDVEKLMRAWFDALSYFEKNRGECVELMARAQDVSPAELSAALNSMAIYTREGVHRIVTGAELPQQMQVLSVALKSINLLKRAPKPEDLIEPSIMRKIGAK